MRAGGGITQVPAGGGPGDGGELRGGLESGLPGCCPAWSLPGTHPASSARRARWLPQHTYRLPVSSIEILHCSISLGTMQTSLRPTLLRNPFCGIPCCGWLISDCYQCSYLGLHLHTCAHASICDIPPLATQEPVLVCKEVWYTCFLVPHVPEEDLQGPHLCMLLKP